MLFANKKWHKQPFKTLDDAKRYAEKEGLETFSIYDEDEWNKNKLTDPVYHEEEIKQCR